MQGIPRYIYHITTALKYEAMSQENLIRATSSDQYVNGIFTVELKNLFKRWTHSPDWNYHADNLQFNLLKHISLRSDIVILRIPTKDLNVQKLKIRSQNIFYNWFSNPFHRKYFLPEDKTAAYEFLKVNSSKEIADHLSGQALAITDARHYTRKKHAVEYIYQGDIPMEQVTLIGKINIRNFKNSDKYNPLTPIKSIFLELLKGTPEEKGATLLKY